MAISFFKIIAILFILQTPILHEPIKNLDKLNKIKQFKKPYSSQSFPKNSKSFPKNSKKSKSSIKSIKSIKSISSMSLDSQTNKWSFPKTKFNYKITPSVFPMERIGILERIGIDNKGKIIAEPKVYSKTEIFLSNQLPTSSKYRYYNIKYKINQTNKELIIPSIAPIMIFSNLNNTDKVKIYKNNADLYYLLSKHKIIIDFKVAVNESYFHLKIPSFRLSSYSSWKGASELRKITRKYLGTYKNATNFIPALIRYLKSFKVQSLSKYKNMGLAEAIFKQKKGVCRHRALLFVGITQAYGLDTRLIYNNVHAFAEIRFNKGQWMQVDLGGAQIPRQSVKSNLNTYKYTVFMNKIDYKKHILFLTINYEKAPPVLWFSLINKQHKILLKKPLLLNPDSKILKKQIKLPKLSGGNYILRLNTQK